MPPTDNALYSRGKYRLERDKRSPCFQIVWYDKPARRNRSISTGSAEIGAAEDALDRMYLKTERGLTVCPTCGHSKGAASGHLLTNAISDYLLERDGRASIGSIKPRLAHFQAFMASTKRDAITCDQVDASMIEQFRAWSKACPVIEGKAGKERQRSLGTTEASVRQIAAVINFAHDRKDTPFPAGFAALAPAVVSQTPQYRSTVEELAGMFRYCVAPVAPVGVVWTEKQRLARLSQRHNLLRFLQVSVATWARPDAVHDLSTDPERRQWLSNARVVMLNPKGRPQTKKYRPVIPVPERFARIMDATSGYLVTACSVQKAFEAMQTELGLPRDRETGMKLIRRSVAQLLRREIGEANWTQGEMMLGHRKASTSDLYALFDPANLGLALKATEGLIERIEALCPGAFGVMDAPVLRVVSA